MYGHRGGFGFRGSTPPWPYIGRGRGGLPRCGYYWGMGYTSYPSYTGAYQMPPAGYNIPRYTPSHGSWYYPAASYSPFTSREHELDVLKSEAEAMNARLKEIDARIEELGSE